MEHQKILNLMNEANGSKFVTRKWNTFNDQSNANCDVEMKIIYYLFTVTAAPAR